MNPELKKQHLARRISLIIEQMELLRDLAEIDDDTWILKVINDLTAVPLKKCRKAIIRLTV